MGFADINAEELNLFMLLVDFMETDRPLDVGRSGETAKHQCDRFLAPKIRKCYGFGPGCVSQGEVRRQIAHLGSVPIHFPLDGHCLSTIFEDEFHVVQQF